MIELLAHWQTELFIAFPYGMRIQRYLPRDESSVRDWAVPRLKAFFGTEEWAAVYREHRGGLRRHLSAKLLTLYAQRLKERGYRYVHCSEVIRSTGMHRTPHHTYQVLTKRPNRAAEMASQLRWTSNIWMGTGVESQEVLHRITDLVQIPAHIRFLSLEPLLGPLPSLPLDGIDWVIVGGESGPKARPMKAEWVRQIRGQCLAHGVAFFFKQWGGFNKKATGRILGTPASPAEGCTHGWAPRRGEEGHRPETKG